MLIWIMIFEILIRWETIKQFAFFDVRNGNLKIILLNWISGRDYKNVVGFLTAFKKMKVLNSSVFSFLCLLSQNIVYRTEWRVFCCFLGI